MSASLESQSLDVNIIIGFVGLVTLALGSDEAVKRLVGLAACFNLSTTFMGMTVVSVGDEHPRDQLSSDSLGHLAGLARLFALWLKTHQGISVCLI